MFHCLLLRGWVQQEDSCHKNKCWSGNSVQSGLDPVTGSLRLCAPCNSDYPSCNLLHLLKVLWGKSRQMMWKTFASNNMEVYVLSSATRPLQVTPLWWLWARSRRRHSVQTDSPSRQDASKVPCSTPPRPISSHMRSFPLLSDNAPFPIPHYEYRARRRCWAVDCMTIAESRLSEMLCLWHCISCLETGGVYQSSCNLHRNSYRPRILCSTKIRVVQFPELYCALGKTSPRTKPDKCSLHTNATNKY